MNSGLISSLYCIECSGQSLTLELYDGDADIVIEGRLVCMDCAGWYRIQNGIVDMLPASLRRVDKRSDFAKKHKLQDRAIDKEMSAQKDNQIEYFCKEADDYESTVTNSPYFMSMERVVYEKWVDEKLRPGSMVLDVGCGTGRQTLPLARRQMQVMCADVSEEMLALAQKKASEENLLKFCDFIVCDAERIPLKKNLCDACVMTGVLHHVEHPELAIENASKVLRVDGYVFSYDPHKSPVRFVFDWSMRLWKLYDEEASDDPLFSEKVLKEMYRRGGIECETKISTYVLPHLFQFFGNGFNDILLRVTDCLFSKLPLFRKMGGMVIAEGRRKAVH